MLVVFLSSESQQIVWRNEGILNWILKSVMLFAPVHIHICDYMIDIWKRRVGGSGKKEQQRAVWSTTNLWASDVKTNKSRRPFLHRVWAGRGKLKGTERVHIQAPGGVVGDHGGGFLEPLNCTRTPSMHQNSFSVCLVHFAKFFCKGILVIWSTKWSLFAKLFA